MIKMINKQLLLKPSRILLLILIIACSCQNDKHIYKDGKLQKVISLKTNKTLKEFRYYDNGELKEEVINPIYDTLQILIDSISFDEKIVIVLTGEIVKYNKKGSIIMKGNYLKSNKVGVWEYFNDEGILIKTEEF